MNTTRQYTRAGTCDECGHAVGGVIVYWGDEDPTVHCATCTDPSDAPSGIYVKERTTDDDRWFPGDDDDEIQSMSP